MSQQVKFKIKLAMRQLHKPSKEQTASKSMQMNDNLWRKFQFHSSATYTHLH